MADDPGAVGAGTAPAERYEQLRQLVLGGQPDGWRYGLGALTSRGLAGWMRAATGPSPAPPTMHPARPGPTPAKPAAADRAGEVIAVLAQMALAHT